jgi:deoxyribodipyrimidine photo-lyase
MAPIADERVCVLHEAPIRRGRYVLYWMQASQRTRCNHALEFAAARANALGQPLLVLFVLMDGYPEANLRHYHFMLQGLRDVAANLQRRGAAFVIRRGEPAEVVLRMATVASEIVCDRGYTRHQRRWREALADAAPVRVTQVEAHVVVPVETASDHAEFAARTLRPKIERLRSRFLAPPAEVRLKTALGTPPKSDVNLEDLPSTLASLQLDTSVAPTSRFLGGEEEALRRLSEFVRVRLGCYEDHRSDPARPGSSELSPYLHFGHLSPIQVAHAASNGATRPALQRHVDALLEELIVRRELAINYVHYTPGYDRYEALPSWARRTLESARRDRRPVTYTRAQLEAGDTHDRWWNAAMREMRDTGYMHNYMRMYWGKKVIEWKRGPEEAFEDLLYLNNRYFVDGRDPSGYVGVAWCFGLHDRPWKSRPIFGQIRYMNAAGLQRKFEMASYEASTLP